jgi:hypothetical protein
VKQLIKQIIKDRKIENVSNTMENLISMFKDLFPGNSSITKENIEKIRDQVMKEIKLEHKIKKKAKTTQRNMTKKSSPRRQTRKNILNHEKDILYALYKSDPQMTASELVNALNSNSSIKLSPSVAHKYIKELTGENISLNKNKTSKKNAQEVNNDEEKTQSERDLNTLLHSHQHLFFNLSSRSNLIKENGKDGNCMYYSVLDSLVNPLQLLPLLSSYEIQSVEHKTIHGFRLRAIITDYIRICELILYNKGRTSSTINRNVLTELRQLTSKLGIVFNSTTITQIMKRVSFFSNAGNQDVVSDILYDGHGYRNLRNNVHSWAGQSTLMAMSILFQKHIIVFQLDEQSRVIIQKYDESIPLLNGNITDSPNYIFLVRNPGNESHYRSIRKANKGSYIKLSNLVLDKMNTQPKEQYTFDEFNEFASRASMNAQNNEWVVLRRSNLNASEDIFNSSERKIDAVVEHMLQE